MNSKLKSIYQFQNNTCFFCRKPIESGEESIEHLCPSSRGGLDSFDNCVVVCKKINQFFGSISVVEKMELLIENNGRLDCRKIEAIKKDKKDKKDSLSFIGFVNRALVVIKKMNPKNRPKNTPEAVAWLNRFAANQQSGNAKNFDMERVYDSIVFLQTEETVAKIISDRKMLDEKISKNKPTSTKIKTDKTQQIKYVSMFFRELKLMGEKKRPKGQKQILEWILKRNIKKLNHEEASSALNNKMNEYYKKLNSDSKKIPRVNK
jgi:hypothetical protein